MKTRHHSALGVRYPARTAIGTALVAAFTLLTTIPRAPAQTNFGMAVSFDGIDDCVALPAGVWFTGPFTVEGWVYLHAYNDQGRFFDFGNASEADNIHAALSVDYAHYVQFGTPVYWSWVTTSTSIPLHTWTHVAFVYDTQGIGHICIDGTDVASGPLVLPLNVPRADNFLGRGVSALNADATFDEVRIWSVARDTNQIQANMRTSLTGAEAGLMAYYRFDEQAGDIAYDSTPNHRNGTLRNRPLRVPAYWVPMLVLNGVNPATNECHSLFADPGATVTASPVAIAAGGQHSLALRADGTIIGWGASSDGQISIPATATDVVAVAAGAYHSLALRADGAVVGWGSNGAGETNVPPNATNVVAIAAGGQRSLALRSDGTLVGWGLNAASIPSTATNVVAVASGYDYSLALRDDGSIVAWGSNNQGQTGVSGSATHVVAIAAGTAHSLALRDDGTIVGWGWNQYGQLNVPPYATNAVGVAAGYGHSLALKADGTVVAWGDNTYGQTNVPAGLADVVAIAAGLHNVALKSDGTIVTWGDNTNGQTNTPAGLRTIALPVAIAGPLNTNAVGVYTLTYSATNNFGATAATTRTVRVLDTQPPQITCSNLVVKPDRGQCTRSNVTYTASATDVCAGANVSLAFIPPSGSTFPLGTTPVTCWAADPSGNSNNCTFTVTVTDCGPGSCLTNYTIAAGAMSLIANQLDNGNNTLAELLPHVPPGTILKKFNPCQQSQPWFNAATNTTGTAWVPATVTLAPGDGAYLELPSNQPPVQLTFTGRARCAPTLPIRLVQGYQLVSSQRPEPGTFASIVGVPPMEGATVSRMNAAGTYDVYSYVEGAGWMDNGGDLVEPTARVGEAWLLFWPRDNQPPLIPCPPDLFVIHDPGQCSKSNVTYSVSAYDNPCGGANVVCTPPSGSTFPLGTNTVTCWATDAAGNSNSCTFNVFVKELEIAFGATNGEAVVTWPACANMRLQYADALLPGLTTAWWDVPGAASPYSDWFASPASFDAVLTCGQMVPPAPGCAPPIGWAYNGLASCTLAGNATLTVQLQFRTGTTNSLFVHVCGPAGPGANANRLYALDLTSSPVTQGTDEWYHVTCPLTLVEGTGNFSISDQVQQLRNGRWYLLIGTADSPSGEIRGQLQPAPRNFGAALTCNQLVPPAGDCEPLKDWGYNGQATCALDGNQLKVQLKFWIFDYAPGATSVLIHGPAGRGTNAAGLYALTNNCPIILGADGWYHVNCGLSLAEGVGGRSVLQQIEQLRAGLWYFTLNTEFFPDGEIRGQLQPAANRYFRLVKP